MSDVTITHLVASDIRVIAAVDWNKTEAQYERYLSEQNRGEREVLVARDGDTFAGYVTIVWESGYPPFHEASIPEIVDFNVVPTLRRRGIGTQLMEAAEGRIAERSAMVGIGVGMDKDYGAAQRLYVKRGYIPDGRGLAYDNRQLAWGETTRVDDSLALYFTKDLGSLSREAPRFT